MNNLANKIVFITGASSGIGKSCAEAFAGQKSNLILTARRIEKLDELAKNISVESGVKVKCIELDVRDKDKVNEVVSSLDGDWKNIDFLINNAGLARGFGKIYEGETEDWEEMIDTNIKGLLYVTRQILPLMILRKNGHIINIGSLAGHEVYPNGNVYAATKFAVNALSKSIRLDVINKGIRVSSVDPGLVETEFSIVRFSGDVERAKNVYSGIEPLTAEDIAEAVLFCANRPAHVNINEVILTPVAQASATLVHRKTS
jgi:serine 3-dehydrogenase